MSKEAMKLALEAAYLAGFNASGEGYNGEYPFQDHNAHPAQDDGWCQNRDAYIRKALAEQPAPMIRGDIRDGLVDDEPAQQEQEPGVAVFELQESGWEIICDGDWIQTLPLRTKLYTSPQPAQRKPLRGERFVEIARAIAPRTVLGLQETIPLWIVKYGRAIEAAHGIKGDA